MDNSEEVMVLSSLGRFSKGKRLQELKDHYARLDDPDYSGILWAQIIAGTTTFTLDMFFAVLQDQDLTDIKVRKHLAQLMRKNKKLRQAILAGFGDETSALALHRNSISMEVMVPAGTSAASMIADGFLWLRRNLIGDRHFAHNFLRDKNMLRRLSKIDPLRLDPVIASVIINDQKLWEQFKPRRTFWEYFRGKQHYLVRCAKVKATLTARGGSDHSTEVDNVKSEVEKTVAASPTTKLILRKTIVEDSAGKSLAKSGRGLHAVQTNLFSAINECKSRALSRDLACHDKENIGQQLSSESVEEIRIKFKFGAFRRRIAEFSEIWLKRICEGADFLRQVELELGMRGSVTLGEADHMECVRGGDYYSMMTDSREKDLTLEDMRKNLQQRGLSVVESERVLQLILQSQQGVPSCIGGILTEIGRSFIPEDYNIDKLESSEKLLWVNKQDGLIHITLKVMTTVNQGTDAESHLFQCVVELSYNPVSKALIGEASIHIQNKAVAESANSRLKKSFPSYIDRGIKCFTVVPAHKVVEFGLPFANENNVSSFESLRV